MSRSLLSSFALAGTLLVGCDGGSDAMPVDEPAASATGAAPSSPAPDAPLPGGRDREATIQELQAGVRKRVEAMYGGDADTIVATTSPEVIAQLGGEESMREILQEQLDMLQQYVELIRVEFPEPPTFASAGERLFVRVPFVVISRGEGDNEVRNPNHSTAVLEPGAASFVYVEGTTTLRKLLEFYPDLPAALQIE